MRNIRDSRLKLASYSGKPETISLRVLSTFGLPAVESLTSVLYAMVIPQHPDFYQPVVHCQP